MVFPASASPPSPDRKRRGKYFAVIGAFLAVLVPLGGLAAVAVFSGEGPTETTVQDVPPTTVKERPETTIPQEPEPSPQDVVAAALSATDELTTYHVSMIESFAEGRQISMVGLFSGDNSSLEVNLAGYKTNRLKVGARLFVTADDGGWLETLEPARIAQQSADPVEEIWRSLQAFDVVEGNALTGRYVLACPRDLRSVDKAWRWICESEEPFRPRVRLDPTLTFVARFYAQGDIPINPEDTRAGSMTITVEVSDEPLVVELPEVIDESGIECLGQALGAPGVSATVLSVLIDENTTEENSQLFGGCGYDIYPPGVDFDLR